MLSFLAKALGECTSGGGCILESPSASHFGSTTRMEGHMTDVVPLVASLMHRGVSYDDALRRIELADQIQDRAEALDEAVQGVRELLCLSLEEHQELIDGDSRQEMTTWSLATPRPERPSALPSWRCASSGRLVRRRFAVSASTTFGIRSEHGWRGPASRCGPSRVGWAIGTSRQR
jgi:hypothetical protein